MSILSQTEIAAYRADGVVVPEFRLPPDRLAHLQSLAARLIADNPHMGDEPVASRPTCRAPGCRTSRAIRPVSTSRPVRRSST